MTMRTKDIPGFAWGWRIVLCALCSGACGGPVSAQCHYTWVEIPNPVGWRAYGRAINNLGHVAGILENSGENARGFIWTPETGTQIMPFPPGISDMTVLDINDHGHVVGSARSTSAWYAFFWDGVTYTLINRPAWATQIEAVAINNSDQVVGNVNNNIVGPNHVFFWESGAFYDLGDATGQASVARAIDESGRAFGFGFALHDGRSFAVDGDNVEWFPHPAGPDTSDLQGVNNNGFAVGWCRFFDPVQYWGVIWTPGAMHVVTPPAGYRDVRFYRANAAGRVVGKYDWPFTAPIAWQDGVVTELTPLLVPTPSWTVYSGLDINDRGQIVARREGGSFVLNPVWLSGDITGDCHVSLDDLALLLADFGSPVGTFPRGDVDIDGDVDLTDLAVLLTHWGE